MGMQIHTRIPGTAPRTVVAAGSSPVPIIVSIFAASASRVVCTPASDEDGKMSLMPMAQNTQSSESSEIEFSVRYHAKSISPPSQKGDDDPVNVVQDHPLCDSWLTEWLAPSNRS